LRVETEFLTDSNSLLNDKTTLSIIIKLNYDEKMQITKIHKSACFVMLE